MKSYVDRATLGFALTIGPLGAARFIISQRLGLMSGRNMLWIYGAFFIASAIALYFWKFRRYTFRYIAGFGAFLVAALTHYAYSIIGLQDGMAISPFGHLLRVAFLLIIGASINLLLLAVSAGIKLVILHLSGDSRVDQDFMHIL